MFNTENYTYWSSKASSPGIVGDSTTYYSCPITKIKLGTSMPDYKGVIANGGNATTYYERHDEKLLSHADVEIFAHFDDRRLTWSHGVGNVQTYPAPQLYDGDCGSDLIDKYKEAMSNLNLMTAVAEDGAQFRGLISQMAKATETYLKTADRMISYGLRFRHFSGSSRRDLLEAFSSTWLSWSFGLKPMMSSIETLAHLHASHVMGKQANVLITARDSVTDSIKRPDVPLGSSNDWNFHSYLKTHVEIDVSVKYLFGFDPSINDKTNAHSALGLGDKHAALTSAVCTLWELVPYSWIVDYFTTVGDVLEGFRYSRQQPGYIYGCKTQKGSSTTYFTPVVEGDGDRWSANRFRTGIYKSSTFLRTPVSSFPAPKLRFRSFNDGLEKGNPYARVANLASCLAGKGKLLSRLLT